MADNIFGGLGNLGGALGGLVDGLAQSGLIPKDDPNVKIFNAQKELTDLKKQEADILIEIGRKSFEANPSAFPQGEKLRLIRANMQEAEASVNALKVEQEATEKAQAAEDAMGRCPHCGNKNPEGIKFCQECGGKLGNTFCTSCGAEMSPDTRFCGECGAKQEE